MDGLISPAGLNARSLIQSSRAPPVNPSNAVSRVNGSESQREEKEDEEKNKVSRPSILNLDKEGIERSRSVESNQKVFEPHAPAEVLGLLGNNIDLKA